MSSSSQSLDELVATAAEGVTDYGMALLVAHLDAGNSVCISTVKKSCSWFTLTDGFWEVV